MKKFMQAATITLAMALALAACGGSSETTEAASGSGGTDVAPVESVEPADEPTATAPATPTPQAPTAEPAVAGDVSDDADPGDTGDTTDTSTAQPVVTASGSDLCTALVTLVQTVDIWDGTSFDDTDQVRAGAEAITANLLAAQAAADGPVRADLDLLVELWTPWAELLETAEYEFFAIDPEQAAFLFDEEYAARFEASTDALADHAVNDCGIDPTLVETVGGDTDTASDSDESATDASPVDPDTIGTLAGPGVILVRDTGERFEMTEGFCGLDPNTGVIVGSFSDGTREISFVADTTGDQPNINAVTIAGAGSAAARMPVWEIADDRQSGSFTTRDMSGSFRCN